MPEPADVVGDLRRAVQERGGWLSHDGAVKESTAAELLGRSPRTLANWRSSGEGPRWFKRNGRALYPLTELAAFLAEGGGDG